MLTIFIVSVLFIIYTYALFPIFLHFKAQRKPELQVEEPKRWPTVSIVIAAHNEAENISTKLKTLEALDYPSELQEWIFVSDGSTDGTNTLLENAFRNYPNRKQQP